MKNIFSNKRVCFEQASKQTVLEKLVYLSLTFQAQCDDVVKLNCRDCIRTVNQSDFSQIQLTSMTKHTCSLTQSVIIINFQLQLYVLYYYVVQGGLLFYSQNEFLHKISKYLVGSIDLLSHNTLKCSAILVLSFFVRCWQPWESMLWGSSTLSEFRTSLSKVLTL